MLYEITGNLITDKRINVMCHQTNCRGRMGAGLAKQIAETYPVVKERDIAYCLENNYAKSKLLGTNLYVKVSPAKICVNMYAQYNFGKGKRYTEYDKLSACLRKLGNKLSISDKSLIVGFPAGLGCGNAGGDWNIVKPMIEEFAEMVPQDVYIVKFTSASPNCSYFTARYTGNSVAFTKEWQSVTVFALPKTYLLKCGNNQKYYYSEESIWKEWECLESIHLPKLALGA